VTTPQVKLAGRVGVLVCATVFLFAALVIGCSTPRKAAEEPASTTTVTIQPPARAPERDENLEVRQIASAKATSLGASSGGRSR
jgi:hypothetical protein